MGSTTGGDNDMSKVQESILEQGKKTKVCPRCGKEKSLDKFSNGKREKDEKHCWCKECCKKYRQENREKLRIKRKQYNQSHKEETSEYNEKYHQEHKEERKEYNKQYHQKNKEKINERRRQYRQEHKDEWEQYSQDHKEETREYNKKYRQEHKKERNEHERNKRKTDPLSKFKADIRVLVYRAFKNLKLIKGGKTFELLGYTPKELYIHLMSFVNKPCVYNKCNIEELITVENSQNDHIIPTCIAETKEDIIKLNQLNNLRLIHVECNLKKSPEDSQMKREKKTNDKKKTKTRN